MRNLRKLLAVVLAITMMVVAMAPAFAADAAAISADAKVVSDIGMLKGAGSGVDAAYTATEPTRIQAAILFLRLKGLEATAQAFTGTDNFSDVTADWQKPYTAYLKANPDLGFAGIGDGKFDPAAKITAAQYYKVVLTALGYKQKADANDATGDFLFADVLTFAADKGLSKVAAATTFTIDSLASATVEGLKAAVKGGTKTLAETLVDAKAIDATKAEAAGVYTAAPAVQALDVDTAVAINSKLVEVALNTAVTATSAADFTVKDSAGKAIAVTAAELASYDTDNKTVLVTLEADTTLGSLYTLTSGEKSVNFGGKAVDTTKPTVSSIVSNDYNEVEVTFSEPVKLDGASFALTMKYGAKTALTVSNYAYDGNNKITVTTSDQTKDTLYATVISGVKDFAGNLMDSDDAKTFVGTGKSTDALKFNSTTSAKALDYNRIAVLFNLKVDDATLKDATFTVAEAYGNKTAITVSGAAISDDDNDVVTANDDKDKTVVITLGGEMKANTLYNVTVSGSLKSKYGTALSGTASEKQVSCAGVAKPASDSLTYTVSAKSNTSIELTFANKLDVASATTVANYTIAEAYGAKAALAVTAAAIKDDTQNKVVKLTVGAMKATAYKVTVTGVKDSVGNSVKTTSDANIVLFSGKAIAAEIKALKTITWDATNTNTQIILTFDQNVGSTATDVSHYTIDNSVGYPSKAETGWTGALDTQVKLTIPKTTLNKTYKVTVKGLENSDGVAMGSDGVSLTFVGRGTDATLPSIQAAIATDNQTIKIYFDRDVTDGTIDGATKIWDDTTHRLVSNAMKIVKLGAATVTYADAKNMMSGGGNFDAVGMEYAYQDPENDNVLVVRYKTAGVFKSANANVSLGGFKIFGDMTANAEKFNADNSTAFVSSNEDDAANVVIDNVIALNRSTIRVYFNQPVYGSLLTFAKVCTTSTYGGTNALTAKAYADDTNKVVDFKLTTNLTAGTTYYLVVNPALAVDDGILEDVVQGGTFLGTAFVTMEDEDTGTGAPLITQYRQFAGNGDAPADIKDISVVMTDAKTLVVYFPDVMDTTVTGTDGAVSVSATDFNDYTIVNAAGTAVTMSDDTAFDNTTDIGAIKYDLPTNKATITLNKTIKTATGGAFLKFPAANGATLMMNAAGTASVKDDTTTVNTQFAISATDPALVTIESAAYNGTTGVLTITLNQKAVSGNAGGGLALTAAQFANDFNVWVDDGTGTLVKATTGNVNFGVMGTLIAETNISNTVYGDTITVQLTNLNIASGFSGKVEFNTTTGSNLLTGINGELYDDASNVAFAQKTTDF